MSLWSDIEDRESFCIVNVFLRSMAKVGSMSWTGLAIIMNQFSPASENFFLSPLLCEQPDHSPYLSPFPNPYNHPQQPADLEDLLHFRLDDPPLPTTHTKGETAGEEEQSEQREAVEESSEANEPANTPEAPTEHVEANLEEASPPFFTRSSPKDDSEISNMIEFLVEHSQLCEESLQLQGRKLSGGNLTLLRAFRILAGKFRRLRKTKQQMTKYCIRKAFKFIAASRNSPARDLDHCMQQYFEDAGDSFSIPFKKHSSEKTMNANFLKRIFACNQFAEDYRLFLGSFRAMVAEDNLKKAKYLAELVQEALEKGDVQVVAKIKRLPWTAITLQQVIELATTMPELAPVRLSRRRSIE